MQIRVAKEEDADALLKIYAPYVEKTAITFEYEVPDVETFRERISNTLKKYPYLLAWQNGEILGYAYTGAFVGRAAYGWAAEVSIYLREDKRGMGIGKKLYTALEAISKAQHILNLNACIGNPEVEDQYLTKNSILFHTHMGYTMVGEFHKCGYKFGNWYNMVWMEKVIGKHDCPAAPVIAFPDLSAESIKRYIAHDYDIRHGWFHSSVL
ncbi:MAG: GNAT family N-acetyltransferase [Lachnospiraceae bacterium]|nr:GNAT family N-acetyltransferase [Lachnospiraceae bacterium]